MHVSALIECWNAFPRSCIFQQQNGANAKLSYLFSTFTIKTQGNKLPAPSCGKILIQADQHTYKVFGFDPHSQAGSDS